MAIKCCICKRRSNRNVRFHKIPDDERRRRQWSDVCRMEFPDGARICGDHFVDSHVVKNPKRHFLLPCAVPCVNLCFDDPLEVASLDSNDNCVQDCVDETTGKPILEGPFKDADIQTQPTIIAIKIKKLQAMNRNLQGEIDGLKSQIGNKNKSFNSLRKLFTPGQLRKIKRPEMPAQWSRDDVANAIRLHSNGPKAYNYLKRQGLPLPPVAILENWCRKVVISEGFLSTCLGFFRHCTDFTNEDKICVLVFDELNVEEKECSEMPTEKTAKRTPIKYAQVVVAQGLWKSWKRPVFYSFDNEMKKEVLYTLIEKLNKATFPVVAVVSDVKWKNRKLWRDLGVTTANPWFSCPGKSEDKIFTFADAGYLLEKLRYQFLETGLLWHNDVLDASVLATLIQSGNNSKLELTDEHLMIEAEGLELATQLFSRSTAKTLRQCIEQGFKRNQLSETADFIEAIAEWFDVMNSGINSFTTPGQKPFGMSLPDQESILLRLNKWLASTAVPGKVQLNNFEEGIVMNNTALPLLYDYAKEKFGMSYILTNRLNHHELKHLMEAVQSNEDVGEYLTPNEFKDRLKKYIFAQNILHLHGTENVESSMDEFFCSTTAQEDNVSNGGKRRASEELSSSSKHQKIDPKTIGSPDCASTSVSSTSKSQQKIRKQLKEKNENIKAHEEAHVVFEIIAEPVSVEIDRLEITNEDVMETDEEDAIEYLDEYT